MMEEVSLREYIEVMLRWKWLIIGVTLVTMAVAAVLSFIFITPTYQAEAVFSLEVPPFQMGEAANAAIQQIGIATVGPDVVLNSLNRPDFLERVVARLDGKNGEQPFQLRKELSIEADKEKSIFTISANSITPERAQELANAAMEELKAYVSDLSAQGMEHGLQALDGQRQEAEKSLGTAQEELRRLMAQPPTLEQLQAEKDALNAALAAGMSRQASLPGELAAAQAELAQAQVALAKLPEKTILKKAILAPDGGTLVPVEEETVNASYQVLHDQVNVLAGKVAGLKAEQNTLGGIMEANKQRLADINLRIVERSQTRSSLEDKIARRKALADSLADQINELRIAQTLGGQVPLVRVLAPAILPDAPASPRGALNVAVAAVLGLMVSAFLAFFIEYGRTWGVGKPLQG